MPDVRQTYGYSARSYHRDWVAQGVAITPKFAVQNSLCACAGLLLVFTVHDDAAVKCRPVSDRFDSGPENELANRFRAAENGFP